MDGFLRPSLLGGPSSEPVELQCIRAANVALGRDRTQIVPGQRVGTGLCSTALEFGGGDRITCDNGLASDGTTLWPSAAQQLMGDEPDRAVSRSSRALERCNTPGPWPSPMGEWPEARLDTTRANLAGEIWLLAVAILFWSSKCSLERRLL